MRLTGKLIMWDDTKAFGFILPNGGGEHIFVHKNAFLNKTNVPRINDIITFFITKDKKGRYCAKDASYTGENIKPNIVRKTNLFSVYLAVVFLLFLSFVFIQGYITLHIPILYAGASVLTFIAYAFDKSKAQRGAWRTKENTLHILALLGGWPGAAIAQQVLRHKTKKKQFRIVFWFTVIINSSLLGWFVFL